MHCKLTPDVVFQDNFMTSTHANLRSRGELRKLFPFIMAHTSGVGGSISKTAYTTP